MNEVWIFIFAFIYDVIVRLIPTSKNLSISDKVKNIMTMCHNLLDIMIPNNKKDEEK